MTFDMQAARDLLRVYAPGFARPCEIEALAAALDRIEELEAKIEKAKTDNNHCVVADWKFEEYRKRIEEQANRIAELEAENGFAKAAIDAKEALLSGSIQRIKTLEGDLSDYKKTARDLDRDLTKKAMHSDKQRAALKKLGQAKRARGKALVEERAGCIACDASGDFVDVRGEYMFRIVSPNINAARDQLRQEGLI
jgi:chromosome segregation ATPase